MNITSKENRMIESLFLKLFKKYIKFESNNLCEQFDLFMLD